ncbi:MAG TPA: tetratricopeptide repeat protein [Kiritimatiellia bacterium]|nr:tetratricopeptide repeat protein [Kiritimatiellia bacterium]HNR94807.1 tetratricopeptide repeat protein [Kiritimatiellia bacterium]
MSKKSFLSGLLILCILLAAVLSNAQDDSPNTLYREGMGFFAEGNFEMAAERFSDLISRFGNEEEFQQAMATVFYALGCSQYNIGQYEECAGTFEKFANVYPNAKFVDEGLFRIGSAYFALENYEKAIEAFQNMMEKMPQSSYAEDSFYQIGVCHMLLGDFKEAAESFLAFTQAFPNTALYSQATVLRARALFELDEWEQSLDALRDLEGRGRSFEHITIANFLAREIGDIAFDYTDYDLALDAYRRVQTKEFLLRNQRRLVEGIQFNLELIRRKRLAGQDVEGLFRQEQRLNASLGEAQQMLANLEQMPEYDAALFHRIGRCFFNTDRFWEARVAFTRVIEIAEEPMVREAALFDLALVLNRQRYFDDLIATCTRYLEEFEADEKLVQNGRVPTMAYLRAEAYVNKEFFEEAEVELRDILKKYPNHNQLSRIEFYLALSLAMQEKFDEAIQRFETWLKQYPDDIMVPEAEYWYPISLYYSGQHAKAMPRFREYAAKYPMSVYTPEALYREAMCLYSLEQFKECAMLLGSWMERFPDHYFRWEAKVTRGGALAAIGELERAKAEYLGVTKEAKAFYYMALTDCAKVFKAIATKEAYEEMAKVFMQYINDEPDSGNVIDAAYQAGWALRQTGETDKAQRFYWTILSRHGNTRGWEGFTPVFKDMMRLYGPEGQDRFRADLEQKYSEALQNRRLTLGARLKMAIILSRPPEEQGAEIQKLADTFTVQHLGPEEIGFVGQYFLNAGQTEKGMTYLNTLLTEFPKSAYVAVAHVRMAEAAYLAGDLEKALEYATLGVAEAFDPALYIDAQMVHSETLRALGKYEEAIPGYTEVLANRMSPKAYKPLCLLGLGDCHAAMDRPEKAIAFYQRIYVLYRAYTDAVVQAYLRSGEQFEKLKDRQAAINTYTELINDEKLGAVPEAAAAKERLAKLQ